MEMRFKAGDKVRMVRPTRSFNSPYWGLSPSLFKGTEAEILAGYPKPHGTEYFVRACIDMAWAEFWVMDDMLDPITPLSPFERRVQDYIDRNLGR